MILAALRFHACFQEDAVGAWPALEKWTRKNLERHYGQAEVMAGAIPCERRISPSCPCPASVKTAPISLCHDDPLQSVALMSWLFGIADGDKFNLTSGAMSVGDVLRGEMDENAKAKIARNEEVNYVFVRRHDVNL